MRSVLNEYERKAECTKKLKPPSLRFGTRSRTPLCALVCVMTIDRSKSKFSSKSYLVSFEFLLADFELRKGIQIIIQKIDINIDHCFEVNARNDF